MTISYRELYAPAHFGNSYEVMWPREMRNEILREAKFWGFNAYGDWFDSADLKNPHNNPRHEYLLPQALWERKLANFAGAAELGFDIDLVITPNHVFLDQLRADLLADTSDQRFFGQLLCPSIPGARDIILDNYRRLFRDLRTNGVALSSIAACPFDYGGCACDACRPWIITFGKLVIDILEVAEQFFPGIQARLIGWWWTPEEHDLFKAWADREFPGRFVSLAQHILYGETAPKAGTVLPERCAPHAFVHIGYADRAQPRDVYGPWGPVVAAERLETTVNDLERQGVTGFMAYSEGVFDDVNKALLAGLASGRFSSAGEVLRAYVERYFGVKGADAAAWAEWLAGWGRPFERDLGEARRTFDRLVPSARPSWRLDQFAAKLELFEAHADVLSRGAWDESRLAAAEHFFAVRERLHRRVWGLGVIRHCLHPHYHKPSWYDEWARVAGKTAFDRTARLAPDA